MSRNSSFHSQKPKRRLLFIDFSLSSSLFTYTPTVGPLRRCSAYRLSAVNEMNGLEVLDNEFPYDDLEEGDIRLLLLRPGKETDDLVGELVTCHLCPDDASPETVMPITRDGKQIELVGWDMYDAISYTWGRGGPSTDITIYDTYDPRTIRGYIPIKANLEDALREFRKSIRSNEDRFFWIDAVCIDQENQDEKSNQIRRMKTIYNRAETVRIWLGKETPDIAGAMDFVHELNDFNIVDKLSTDPENATKWRAFRELMRYDWFNRRWIIQEIALARQAFVHCGEKVIPWTDFTYAVSVFVEKASDLKMLFQQSRKYAYNPDYLGELEALGAKVLVDISANLLRKTDDGEVIEYLLPLEALMSTLTCFEASRPHDIVYAILSLAHDAIPDSNQSAKQHEAVQHTPKPSPQNSLKKTITGPNLETSGSGSWVSEETVTTPFDMTGSMIFDLNSLEPIMRRPSNTQQPPDSLAGNFLKPPGRSRALSVSRQRKLEAEKDVRKPFKYIRVNYEKTIFEVCREFLEFAVTTSRSLDMICWPWAPTATAGESDMPSWIVPVSRRPFEMAQTEKIYHRASADSLMAAPGTGTSVNNASGKTKAHRTDPQSSKPLITGTTLMTKGRLLDVIGTESRQAMEGSIPPCWRELGGWHDIKEAPPPRFWRTIVADRDVGGHRSVPAHFPKACQWSFNSRGPRFPVDTVRLLNHMNCPKLAVPFLRRLQAVTWNRKLCLTEGLAKQGSNEALEPLLALVPGDASKGDSICILNGCSVPVVLRKKEHHIDMAQRTKRRSSTKTVKFKGTLGVRVSTWDTRSSNSAPASGSQTPSNPSINTRDSSESVPTVSSLTDTMSTTTSNEKQEDEYILIGECFVYGMMEGEGFKYADDAGHKEREFALV